MALFLGQQEFVVGYSKAPEKNSARPICHSHAMTRTGHEPATIRIAALELTTLCTAPREMTLRLSKTSRISFLPRLSYEEVLTPHVMLHDISPHLR